MPARSSSNTARPILKPAIALPFAVSLTLLSTTTQAQDNPQWGSGKNLYDKVCGHCHKPAVGVGTLLEGRELPPEYIKAIVRNGFNGMPAFPASYIDDAALEQVAKYLGTLSAPATPP